MALLAARSVLVFVVLVHGALLSDPEACPNLEDQDYDMFEVFSLLSEIAVQGDEDDDTISSLIEPTPLRTDPIGPTMGRPSLLSTAWTYLTRFLSFITSVLCTRCCSTGEGLCSEPCRNFGLDFPEPDYVRVFSVPASE